MDKLYTLFLRRNTTKYAVIIVCLLHLLVTGFEARAQYFGQNKVRYKKLNFKVYKTPHFDVYYYMKNDSLVKRLAQENEVWYTLHQKIFRDTFEKRNPVIFYNNHPDFQQSTVIEGEIGVGTGGITEGFKNRIIMPVMETHHTTRHVLGHELVHAFQYHMLLGKDSSSFENLANIPLWMVEGMAEYLSIGKKDAYTAMWMRDAYLNKDIPTVKALTSTNKYFPYRYGEAFWSFIGSTYGDTVIVPFFKNTARFGLQYGIRRTFGFDDKTLSTLWKNSIEATYKPLLKDTVQNVVGLKVIDNKNGSDMNVAPAISPDGNYLTFLSSKSLFSIDLYLADARSGRIIKKLTSKVSATHIDEFNFLESAGAWSPDSKQFAFSVFSHGRNKVVVVDVPSGKVRHTIAMGKAEQISNLSWSPNGKTIVFQGLAEGQGDLYSYNFNTKQIKQLTNDWFSDYQPSYSKDGRKIIFTSDRTTYDKGLAQDVSFNLAELDVATGAITDIKVFNGANNLNPQYSGDGKKIFFLSNRDGFRNLYSYELATGKTDRLTDYFTGISGITEFSPALSVSNNDDIVYSYYRAQKYTLYNAKATDFKSVTIDPGQTDFTAGMLPPPRAVGVDLINANLNNFLAFPRLPVDSITPAQYRAMFKMDAVKSSGIGIGINSYYGAGLSSGIQGMFSDILGQQKIYAGAAVNGQIYDFGASITYINQKSRWDKGIGLSHIPYQFGFFNQTATPTTYKNKPGYIIRNDSYFVRNFEDAVNIFTSYPISRINRVQFGLGASYNSYRTDRYRDSLVSLPSVDSTYYLGSERKKVNNSEAERALGFRLNSYSLVRTSVAFIGDNSFFGVTSPLNGYRYRIEAEYIFGTFKFFSPTIDLRKYVRVAPVTFAGRLYGTGRFGNANGLYPLYVGYPFLIRGYEGLSFYNNRAANSNAFGINQLSGSRIAVANLEIRLPFTGPEKLAQIKSGFLFTDLNLFFDAGLAWNAGDKIYLQKEPPVIGQTQQLDSNGQPVIDAGGNPVLTPVYGRTPAFSAGISMRVNVFGAFVLEPYLAIPFNRTNIKKPVFGVAFAPGW
ncbi:tolB protein precursor [Mucilaginibacter hurinus]|uniref:TolB protein n=1 Tax=Mucilaginibacter hurinus TaxID=2201324 RepID=A0A367GQ97_9SPHI|nr:DPP IV N-terminal domain-containing protein [Mucilaginibacter hurinus]RCH55255.1 tolB protein precursor [Mucilaginibacter hurinus]